MARYGGYQPHKGKYESNVIPPVNERLITLMKERMLTVRMLSIKCIEHGLAYGEGDITQIRRGIFTPSYDEAKVIADVLNTTVEFILPIYENVPEDMRQFINKPRGRHFTYRGNEILNKQKEVQK